MALTSPYSHRQHVLLDTEQYDDAILTGRDAPESSDDGDGLRLIYDGTGMIPCVTVNGPDGAIELRGLSEIRHVFDAMKLAAGLAARFGPPIPYATWKKQQESDG